MSKASRQTVGLLAIISGAMDTIYTCNLAPEHDALTLYIQDLCDDVIGSFPTTGKEATLQRWVEDRMMLYDDKLTSMPREKYNAALLTAMGLHILWGLKNRIKDKKKLALIEPIYEAVSSLNEVIDPKGRKLKEFDRGEYLVSIAYKLFEF